MTPGGELAVLNHALVATPSVIHQDVESRDFRKDGFSLLDTGVVAAQTNDALGQGRILDASTRRVHRISGGAEADGDSFANPSARSSDEGGWHETQACFSASSTRRFCSSAWRLEEPAAGLALRSRPA